MNEWIVPTAGGLLVLVGLGLVAAHVRSWRQQKRDPDLAESDRLYLYARVRRRVQTSGMIALLGVLLGVGDQLPNWQNRPGLFGFYWLGVLLLTGWVMLLALGDFFSTRSHARSSLADIRHKQRELERQVAEFKRRGSNGRDAPH